MKKKVLVGILVLALLSCVLFAFSACKGQVPVYQGMTISDASTHRNAHAANGNMVRSRQD